MKVNFRSCTGAQCREELNRLQDATCNNSFTRVLIMWMLLLISFVGPAIGQRGGFLSGRVIESASGITLPGATIMIEGSSVGTITDIDGRFSFANLDTGETVLIVSFVGYGQKRELMNIIAGVNEEITIVLSPEARGLEEVVITAQLLGQRRAISQQLRSDAIVNIVSEEKLRELPDVNAAEAIGRLPGVALQRSAGEGQKVIIRGLEPKFSAITINGVRVPSNDASNKSVDLSMISSESLAGIEVYKSPTPDMDAEAIGGTVNLILKKAPTESIQSIRVGGAYNALKNDWYNYNAALNLSRRFFDDKLGAIVQTTLERINRSSQVFGGNYQILEGIKPVSFSLEDRLETRDRASGSLNMDYSMPRGSITLYSYYALTGRDVESRTQSFDPFSNNNVRFNHHDNDSDINLWSSMLSGEHRFSRFKIDWSGSYATTRNNTPYASNVSFFDEGAYAHNPNIREDATFPSWADSARTDYSRAHLYAGYLDRSKVLEGNYSGAMNATLPFNIGTVISGYVKGGGKYQHVERSFEKREFAEAFYFLRSREMNDAIAQWEKEYVPLQMTPQGRISMNNFVDNNPYTIGSVLDGSYNMSNPVSSAAMRRWFENQGDLLTEDRNGLVNNYDITESIAAGYLMLKLDVGGMVTIIPGMRYERSVNEYTGKFARLQERYGVEGILRDTVTSADYDDWLPHLHLRIKPTDWFDIRLSYAKTLARPDYNMVIPKVQINLDRAWITAGNPNLKHMEASNYDITMSFYQGRFGLLAVSGFYKDLTNIFFPVQGLYLNSDSLATAWGFPNRESFTLNSFDNSPEASVFGFEIDLQTNLNSLPMPFKGIVIGLNITRQYSETYKYSYVTRDSIVGRDPRTGRFIIERWSEMEKRKITLPGQTPLIFNLSMGYDFKGFSGRVSGSFQDEYLIFPGQSEIQDVSNGSFWRWDIALRQKISEKLIAHMNVANLNSMKEETYRNFDYRYPGRINHYGAMFTFGFQLQL
jgi:TonB-dependent receptor